MKDLVSLTCPNCGSSLQVNSSKMKTYCEFCGTEILIKDFITERRVDKNDRIEALQAMTENAINNGDYINAYNHYEEICKLDASEPNLARYNAYGFLCGRIDFSENITNGLYGLEPDEHRRLLSLMLAGANNNKQSEISALSQKYPQNQIAPHANKIIQKYQRAIMTINAEIKKTNPRQCKCGKTIEFNVSVCPDCGTNVDEYYKKQTADALAAKKAKNKKYIKLGVIIGVPLVIIVLIISTVSYNVRIGNIETAIDNKEYAKAEELIDDYKNSNSRSAEPYLLYAELYVAQGDTEKAIETLEDGLKRVTSSSDKEDLQQRLDELKAE